MEPLFSSKDGFEPLINDFPNQARGIKFKKETLVEELMSLGHAKITLQVAQSIGESVEKEIIQRKIQFLSQELISELVELKLSELGLIKVKKTEVNFAPIPLTPPDTSVKELNPAILNALAPEKKKEEKIEAIAEPQLSAAAMQLLSEQFLAKNDLGEVSERPAQFFSRVAKAVAAMEIKYTPTTPLNKLENEFYNLIASGHFFPSAEILRHVGRSSGPLSSGCAIPINDSMESIFEAMKQVAIVQKSGGGTSLNFSHLRPLRDSVQTHTGFSSGPVSFIKVYEATCAAVSQGKQNSAISRCVLSVQHPDILDFLEILETSNNPSLSLTVIITDAFVEAVEKGSFVDLINPRTGSCIKKANAQQILARLAGQIEKHGQPQIIFGGRTAGSNPTPLLGALENVDPSGTQAVLPFESLHSGAINLSHFVTGDQKINWEDLAKTVEGAIHFLENSLEVAAPALPESEELTRKNRKISLSVMGWADMLIKLGIAYQSSAAETLAGQLMSFISNEAQLTSINLAKKRGPFAHFGSSLYADQGLRRRHAQLTGLMPTETLAVLAGCTPGIEALTSLAEVKEDNITLHHQLEKYLQASDAPLWKEYLKTHRSLQSFSLAPQNVKDIFVTAEELNYETHLKAQAAFQKHIEGSVSYQLPVGLAKNADTLGRILVLAHQLGLKEISWKEVLRTANKIESINVTKPNTVFAPEARPEILAGITRRFQTACGDLTVTMNESPQGLAEVFTRLDHAGLCATAQMEALTRMIDLALGAGIAPQTIAEQLSGIPCTEHRADAAQPVSYPDAIGKALREKLK